MPKQAKTDSPLEVWLFSDCLEGSFFKLSVVLLNQRSLQYQMWSMCGVSWFLKSSHAVDFVFSLWDSWNNIPTSFKLSSMSFSHAVLNLFAQVNTWLRPVDIILPSILSSISVKIHAVLFYTVLLAFMNIPGIPWPNNSYPCSRSGLGWAVETVSIFTHFTVFLLTLRSCWQMLRGSYSPCQHTFPLPTFTAKIS